MKSYRVTGLIFLALAFVFLFVVAVMQGMGKSQPWTRIVLTIIGAGLTFSGATIVLLNKLAS